VAQKHPRFWLHRKVPAAAKVLPPDPNCAKGYLLVGAMKLHNAGYKNENVAVHGVNVGAQLHITPTELLFSALTGTLPDGGGAAGELKIENWLGEVPADSAAGRMRTSPSRSTTFRCAPSWRPPSPATMAISVSTPPSPGR
jgi:translocation and assembly module TamB